MVDKIGDYSKSFITDIPADINSATYKAYKKVITRLPNEGVYIYCFKEGRMLFAEGWKDLVGYDDHTINMLQIVQLSTKDFAMFVHEINDKALMFLHCRNERLKEYSFTIELKIKHKDGFEVPVSATVSVYDTLENGSLKSIQGRFKMDHTLKFGKIMRYSSIGPQKDLFEDNLNANLFYKLRISDKELEVVKYLAEGYAYKQIASFLNISESAVEKRVRPLFKRFEVKNNTHLVAFAFQNNLLT